MFWMFDIIIFFLLRKVDTGKRAYQHGNKADISGSTEL